MYAGFTTSKSKQLVDSALSSRVTRNQLIASNIANIDTPFYKAKDIDFETALIEKRKEIYNQGQSEPKLELARTNDKHFAAINFPSSKIPPFPSSNKVISISSFGKSSISTIVAILFSSFN